MQSRRKNVLCIDPEPSFLEKQKGVWSSKGLTDHLFFFNNITEAFEFIETQIIEKNDKLHYIVLNEKAVGKDLNRNFEKLLELNGFLKKTDVIVVTDHNNTLLRNRIMQYPFVSVFLIKPVPSNYIEFLITGQIA